VSAVTGSPVIALQGKLEMEIAQLPPDDAAMFMQEYGIQELSLNRMVAASYDLLDQQSFFTVGEDEVRAWTTRRQATAVEAASEIHTDIAKGFVRAEVVACSDLLELGSMAEAKSKAKFGETDLEQEIQKREVIRLEKRISKQRNKRKREEKVKDYQVPQSHVHDFQPDASSGSLVCRTCGMETEGEIL
jgi:ribosome-binding ATPase YchF (GTP1/OBG family)